jgi:hypothetical protein
MSWISEDLEGGRRVARADGKLDLVGRALRCESFIEGAYRVHNVKNASDSLCGVRRRRDQASRIRGPAFRLDQTKPNNCNF